MKQQVSAGAILFRERQDQREYLLLKNRVGDWEFPKGGVEDDEELQQTANRELEEETNISDFRLLDGFRDDYSYTFYADGERIEKTVHLFIAKSYEQHADLSDEHSDLQWRDYEQARNTLSHDEPRRILDDAHAFLSDRAGADTDESEPAPNTPA